MTWEELEQQGELASVEWEYVAGTDACRVGLELHGRRFERLAALFEHLPGWGENPACVERPCTCTALPTRRPYSATP